MAILNFTSKVWSETLLHALEKQYIAVANCYRNFEGDIEKSGSIVRLCGLNPVTISTYSPNNDITMPLPLNDYAMEIAISEAKYFNFQIDDVDRAQSLPSLMDEALRVAADGLANDADKYVFSLYYLAKNKITINDPTVENIINSLIDIRQKLYEKNVSNSSDVVIEVSPAIATLLIKAKLGLYTNNNDILEAGCIGNICGCKVFVSNNIATEEKSGYTYHKCYMRTKRAIAFVDKISKVVAYRPEMRFSDGIKGLHLYGGKIIYPDELMVLDFGIPNA